MAYNSYNNGQYGFGGFLNRFPPVTRNILLINIVMYIATMINQNFMISTFAMFYPASPLFRIWQPVTYLFMHAEADAMGREKPKTVGRMLDEKYCIEGACPIVLDCRVVDGRHVFVAKNDGTNLAKAPMDMLPEVMDNDLRAVDGKIREYWGMAPLAASDKE